MWQSEGHPHFRWQRGDILLVNKLIFGKVAICLKFLSSSCHLESEIDCHCTRQGCRQSRRSCFCSYQHSLTKLRAWLGCHGLLVYSCLRTGTEAHPWIPIRWACIFCLLYAGPLPTSKMHCSSRQQLSLSLPSVMLLFPLSKNRCGYSFKFGVYSSPHLPGQDFDRGRVWGSQQTTIGCNFSESGFFLFWKWWLFPPQEMWSQHLGPPPFPQEHLVN